MAPARRSSLDAAIPAGGCVSAMGTPCPRPEKRGPKPPRRIRREKKPKAVATTERAKRRQLEDAVWRTAIKDRSGYACEYTVPHACPSNARDAHHAVKGKGAHPRLRWDLENGICLCRWAHNWAHKNRDAFKAWFSAMFPERFARLLAKASREARLA